MKTRIAQQLTPIVLAVILLTSTCAQAQSGSLYVNPPATTNAAPAQAASSAGGGGAGGSPGRPPDRLSPSISQVSLTAARIPEPRRFAVQDLITIVVRESTQADSEASLDAKKDVKYDGNVESFPDIRMFQEFTDLFLRSGLQDKPKLQVGYKSDFKGDGSYARKDTFTTRITARILDIKPNGTLVLEARKFIRSDKESMNMVLTGTCRKEDISADNTVLSTQLYDLVLQKEHTGELRDASRKGILSKVLDGIFAF